MTTDATESRKSFAEQMRDAAVQRDAEQGARFRTVAEIVAPDRNGRPSRDRVTDVTHIGDDAVAKVELRSSRDPRPLYTTVVDGESDRAFFETMDLALLHLLARRHGASDLGVTAGFAARVLGIPEDL